MKDTPDEAGTGAQPSEPGDLPNACVEGTPPNGAPRVGLGRGWAELPAGRTEGALKPRGRLPSPAAPPPLSVVPSRRPCYSRKGSPRRMHRRPADFGSIRFDRMQDAKPAWTRGVLSRTSEPQKSSTILK